MLSYQHGYHAGNAADVHKHAILAALLSRMAAKDKPMILVETHAGRGLYRLDSAEALKTGEWAGGIGRAEAARWFSPADPYARAIAAVRARFGAMAYPGSPLIAAACLRPGDRLRFAELHPREHAALCETIAGWGQGPAVEIRREDGLAMARATLPPMPRRGVLIVDPSYEVKEEYARMPPFLREIHRKWGVGVLVLWYPVLAGGAQRAMVAALEAGPELPGFLRSEVRFAPARAGHGLIGSGVVIVNAPWGLAADVARIEALFAQGPGGAV
jgi:23S rRNA (adenine2030-N6)-methyltransferase